MKNMHIEEHIPFGRENAVSRVHLMNVTGMNDRAVRTHIEGARRNGVVIINLQDGTGYFQPTPADYDMVKAQWRQEKSRAMKILECNKSAAKWIKKIEGQMEWQANILENQT